jgi:hypothetical protein
MKVCSRKDCAHEGMPQPESNFNRNAVNKDKLDARCKDCHSYFGKERRNKYSDDWITVLCGDFKNVYF